MPHAFVSAFRQHRTSAILRCDDADLAHQAMSAAVTAGIRIIEFTLTTPDAYSLR